ncbi:hypothetical protein PHMEG_00012571 [Phytophthora megakarya]|uniref:Uncharacterized protein n=1 Tax=Phytophthora megakarya TaxID=4795 RepID=A0A225W9Y0_9STRA|nr:hypothetical protein PHMEG_00012571 [Phytophthora megakarya]
MKRVREGIYEKFKFAEASEEALSVVVDCYEKFDLFMGHRLRVVNQQRALHELWQNMKKRCINDTGSNQILLVIDFKMEVGPLYFRENY